MKRLMTMDQLEAETRPVVGKFEIDEFGKVVGRIRCGEQEVVARADGIDSHSPKQMKSRVVWPNLLRSYHVMKEWIRLVWQKPKGGKCKVDSDYMRVNKRIETKENIGCALSKHEFSDGGCVVLPWQVSKGTLAGIEVKDGVSSIRLVKGVVIDEDTTVAELSAAMILANKGYWKEGDVLSYIEVAQNYWTEEENGDGIPRICVSAGRMELSLEDERTVYEVLPQSGLDVCGRQLAHKGVMAGGYCWVRSRLVCGNWHHSTQRLQVEGCEKLWQVYQSEKKRTAVAREYGMK